MISKLRRYVMETLGLRKRLNRWFYDYPPDRTVIRTEHKDD